MGSVYSGPCFFPSQSSPRTDSYNDAEYGTMISGVDSKKINTDNLTLSTCLQVSHAFHDAVRPRWQYLKNTDEHRSTQIRTNKAIKAFLSSRRQVAPGASKLQNLHVSAHLLPYVQAKRNTYYEFNLPGNLMHPELGKLTVYLSYHDEDIFAKRDDMSEAEYVQRAIRSMLDGVRPYIHDFVFEWKGYKNIVRVQCLYMGELQYKAKIFDEKVVTKEYSFATGGLWENCFRSLINGVQEQ